jgi:hypothetical protein
MILAGIYFTERGGDVGLRQKLSEAIILPARGSEIYSFMARRRIN